MLSISGDSRIKGNCFWNLRAYALKAEIKQFLFSPVFGTLPIDKWNQGVSIYLRQRSIESWQKCKMLPQACGNVEIESPSEQWWWSSKMAEQLWGSEGLLAPDFFFLDFLFFYFFILMPQGSIQLWYVQYRRNAFACVTTDMFDAVITLQLFFLSF